jgi:hypothetical protein
MIEQIFKVAELHGICVMGVATTENHAIKALYLECPRPQYGDIEAPGQLSASMAATLGQLLIGLSQAMKDGSLQRDANKGVT